MISFSIEFDQIIGLRDLHWGNSNEVLKFSTQWIPDSYRFVKFNNLGLVKFTNPHLRIEYKLLNTQSSRISS